MARTESPFIDLVIRRLLFCSQCRALTAPANDILCSELRKSCKPGDRQSPWEPLFSFVFVFRAWMLGQKRRWAR